jgi:hypothetical protein
MLHTSCGHSLSLGPASTTAYYVQTPHYRMLPSYTLHCWALSTRTQFSHLKVVQAWWSSSCHDTAHLMWTFIELAACTYYSMLSPFYVCNQQSPGYCEAATVVKYNTLYVLSLRPAIIRSLAAGKSCFSLIIVLHSYTHVLVITVHVNPSCTTEHWAPWVDITMLLPFEVLPHVVLPPPSPGGYSKLKPSCPWVLSTTSRVPNMQASHWYVLSLLPTSTTCYPSTPVPGNSCFLMMAGSYSCLESLCLQHNVIPHAIKHWALQVEHCGSSAISSSYKYATKEVMVTVRLQQVVNYHAICIEFGTTIYKLLFITFGPRWPQVQAVATHCTPHPIEHSASQVKHQCSSAISSSYEYATNTATVCTSTEDHVTSCCPEIPCLQKVGFDNTFQASHWYVLGLGSTSTRYYPSPSALGNSSFLW